MHSAIDNRNCYKLSCDLIFQSCRKKGITVSCYRKSQFKVSRNQKLSILNRLSVREAY